MDKCKDKLSGTLLKGNDIFIAFSTIYFYDAGFSALTESKQKNLLVSGPVLRLAGTSLILRIGKLVKEKE